MLKIAAYSKEVRNCAQQLNVSAVLSATETKEVVNRGVLDRASCDFTFTVNWDSIELYIYLSNFGYEYMSRRLLGVLTYHTCWPFKATYFGQSYMVPLRFEVLALAPTLGGELD